MDWGYAIERNRDALKRVLAALVAMAGLGGGEAERLSSVSGSGGEERPTLPRHLHRAVLRLLRPAESAARRLVIAAARGMAVSLPRRRPRRPASALVSATPRRIGAVTGIWLPPHLRPQAHAKPPAARPLPLFDRLSRFQPARGRKPGAVPRISLPGFSDPHPFPAKRLGSADDALDASRLALRLTALARALDDLDGHARRFARWQAARDFALAQERSRDAEGAPMDDAAAGAQNRCRDAAAAQSKGFVAGAAAAPRRARRLARIWPLKPGRPPGLSPKSRHAVHDLLRDVHSLAALALERSGPS